MGPFFVFVAWGWGDIEMFDFSTKMEARAFYYGIREMMHRINVMKNYGDESYSPERVRESVRMYFGDKAASSYVYGVSRTIVNWMAVDLQDGLFEQNGIGHYTLYNTYMDERGLKSRLEHYIENSAL